VTGFDSNTQAVTRAKRRVAEHSSRASVVCADVTGINADDVGVGYDFFLDVGCYHSLTPPQRMSMGRRVTALAAPGATLLLLAFQPDKLPRPFPRGADRTNVEAPFAAGLSPRQKQRRLRACRGHCGRPLRFGFGCATRMPPDASVARGCRADA
jgi:hypothetical protein